MSLTVEEFVDALRMGLGVGNSQPDEIESVQVKKHYVYGMQGLSNLLGCSISTATRIKKSGVLAPAISQKGKIIVVDADLAIDLLKVSKQGRSIRGGYSK